MAVSLIERLLSRVGLCSHIPKFATQKTTITRFLDACIRTFAWKFTTPIKQGSFLSNVKSLPMGSVLSHSRGAVCLLCKQNVHGAQFCVDSLVRGHINVDSMHSLLSWRVGTNGVNDLQWFWSCLLYTSDAADEEDSVDLGSRRII